MGPLYAHKYAHSLLTDACHRYKNDIFITDSIQTDFVNVACAVLSTNDSIKHLQEFEASHRDREQIERMRERMRKRIRGASLEVDRYHIFIIILYLSMNIQFYSFIQIDIFTLRCLIVVIHITHYTPPPIALFARKSLTLLSSVVSSSFFFYLFLFMCWLDPNVSSCMWMGGIDANTQHAYTRTRRMDVCVCWEDWRRIHICWAQTRSNKYSVNISDFSLWPVVDCGCCLLFVFYFLFLRFFFILLTNNFSACQMRNDLNVYRCFTYS